MGNPLSFSPNASTAPVDIRPPSEAFTGAAEGTQEVGKSLQEASDKQFAFAQQAQALYNKQAADSAAIGAATAVDKMVADWKTNNTQMKAVQSYPQLLKDIEATRASFGENLSPMARSDFESSSRRFTFGSISEASNYTAQQGHAAIVDTADAKAKLLAQQFAASPTPENEQAMLQGAGDSAHSFFASAGLTDPNDPQIREKIKTYISPGYEAKIAGELSSGNVTQANADLAAHKNDLTLEAYDSLSRGLRTVNTANRIESDAMTAIHGGTSQPGVSNPDTVWNNIIHQESGGRPGIPGQVTEYGQPHGETQMLDSTGEKVAKSLGVPWQPELMRGTSPEAQAYQLKLGRAYYEEGLQKYGGDVYKAAEYYYGGPDEKLWGPKTIAYANAVTGGPGGGVPHAGTTFAGVPPPTSSTDPDAYKAQALNALTANAEAMYPGVDNANQREQVIAHGTAIIEREIAPISAMLQDTSDKIYDWVTENGVGDINAVKRQFPQEMGQLEQNGRKYLAPIESAVSYQGNLWTVQRGTNEDHLAELYAAAKNGQAQPFLNTDIGSLDLTTSARKEYQKLQGEIKGGQVATAANDKVFNQVTGSTEFIAALSHLGINPNTPQSREAYGTLKAEIKDWTENHDNTPPNQEQIDKYIMPRVFLAAGGGAGGAQGKPMFEASPTADLARQSLEHQGYNNPDEARVAEEDRLNRRVVMRAIVRAGLPLNEPNIQKYMQKLYSNALQ